MAWLERDGARIYFEDTGGTAPAVVFSHGFLMDHEMFAPQLDSLAQEFRCITWDQRGHGLTASLGSFTYWDSARDVLAILDHLGIARAFFVGMSQGGYLSMRAVLLDPERPRGLVCLDTQAGLEDPDRRPIYAALFERWTTRGADPDVAEVVAEIVLGPLPDRRPWIDKWLAKPAPAVVESYRALIERDDITDRLGDITCPAIVIHGENDAAISIDKAVRLCERLANCEGLVRIRGGSHASNLSHPRDVNHVLRDFFHQHLAEKNARRSPESRAGNSIGR